MRLEGEMKGGFFPAPEEAVRLAASFLAFEEGKTALLDPCCGQGQALLTLATVADRPRAELYAVELEPGRAKAAHQVLQGGNVVGPADFLSTLVTPVGSFGLCWCNPPFAQEFGGGRMEYSFLQRCTQLLHKGKGVMILVCPERVAESDEIANHMHSHYQYLKMLPFPPSVCKYGEVMVFGIRRYQPLAAGAVDKKANCQLPANGKYLVPATPGPRRFVKVGMTQEEVLQALATSPLREKLEIRDDVEAPSPPLELGKGHLSLILAGGFLNTTLQKEGEAPILIKATPFKEVYLKEQRVEESDSSKGEDEGCLVQVYSERIKLKIRVAESSGVIHDLQ